MCAQWISIKFTNEWVLRLNHHRHQSHPQFTSTDPIVSLLAGWPHLLEGRLQRCRWQHKINCTVGRSGAYIGLDCVPPCSAYQDTHGGACKFYKLSCDAKMGLAINNGNNNSVAGNMCPETATTLSLPDPYASRVCLFIRCTLWCAEICKS